MLAVGMLFLLAINGLGQFERGRDYEYTRTANPSPDMLATRSRSWKVA